MAWTKGEPERGPLSGAQPEVLVDWLRDGADVLWLPGQVTQVSTLRTAYVCSPPVVGQKPGRVSLGGRQGALSPAPGTSVSEAAAFTDPGLLCCGHSQPRWTRLLPASQSALSFPPSHLPALLPASSIFRDPCDNNGSVGQSSTLSLLSGHSLVTLICFPPENSMHSTGQNLGARVLLTTRNNGLKDSVRGPVQWHVPVILVALGD